jgi:S-formylglutathione hydrolase FrmB
MSTWTRLCAAVFLSATTAHAVQLKVTAPGDTPTGRLVVFLIREGSGIDAKTEPARGPFWSNPQPMFGIDVIRPGTNSTFTIDDSATSFPDPPGKLPAGIYRAQAALIARHESGNWRSEDGNQYSDVVRFESSGDPKQTVELVLTHETSAPEKKSAAVTIFRVRSELLSKFHRRDVYLKAGVIQPLDFNPNVQYPAVYEVPGFGGTAMAAFERHQARINSKDPDELALYRKAYWIVIDPEFTHGHTMLCNSDNNGPWGDAVISELIPALEAKFNLASSMRLRVIRGHSSGGWAALWLATQYPETFAGCWSLAPDPVDFHHILRLNIYDFDDAYMQSGGEVSTVRDGKATVREENRIEEVLGPHNASDQQWDSWQAAWGRRDATGNAAALFDPLTGAIDRTEADSYRRFDFVDLIKRNPRLYAPIFRDRIHILVGDADTYYLNEAMVELKKTLDSLNAGANVQILRGFTHGSIVTSPQARQIPRQMIDAFR